MKNNFLLSSRTLFFPIVFGFSVFLFSCQPRLYIPNTQNVPLISEKGEGVVSVGVGAYQANAQVAYGVLDHISVQANINSFQFDDDYDGYGQTYEFGLGYNKKLGEKMIFDGYVLGATGNIRNFALQGERYDRKIYHLKGNFRRIGIQPTLGIKSDHFLFGVSARVANLSFSNLEGELYYASEYQKDYINRYSSYFLIEPAFTFGFGLEKLKLTYQFQFSYNVTDPGFYQYRSISSFNLIYNFGRSE